MPPPSALNIGVPFAALDCFRFACGEGAKNHKPEEEAGQHRILHLMELRLRVIGPLSPNRTRTVHLATTDGHRLAHYWWDLAPGEQFLGGPFYLDSREVRAYLARFPIDRQFELSYQLVKVGPQLFVKSEGGEACLGNMSPLEMKFPDYPTIFPEFPKEGAVYKPVSFDGAYLEDFLKFKKNQNAFFRARKKADPKVHWDGPRDLGIVIQQREPLPNEDKTVLPGRITYEHPLLIGDIEFLLMPRSYEP